MHRYAIRASTLFYILMYVGTSCVGCAYVNVVPLKSNDRITRGLRVFEVKPLLFVGQTVEVKLVPNTSKAYAVNFGAFLAKNDFSIQIENGMVKQLDSTLDTTAIIDLLKAIAEKVIPAASTASGPPLTTAPVQVFEFVFDREGNLIALKPIPFIGGLQNSPASPPSQNGGNGTTPKDG
jgi:hypothetical protein